MTPGLPERITRKIGPPDENGCWPWLAFIRPDGYSEIRMGGAAGAMRRAHRVVYELLVGPIPEDRPVLDHVWKRGCRLKHCVNPAHMEPVTHLENQRRRAARITHCPKGHPYDEVNTYRPQRNGRTLNRQCRICRRDYQRRLRAARREVA